MKKLRDVLTIMVFVGLFIFLGLCNEEIIQREAIAKANAEKNEILLDMNRRLEEIVDNHKVDNIDVNLIYNGDNKEENRYDVKFKVALNENRASLDELEEMGKNIAYKLNCSKLSSAKLSHPILRLNEN